MKSVSFRNLVSLIIDARNHDSPDSPRSRILWTGSVNTARIDGPSTDRHRHDDAEPVPRACDVTARCRGGGTSDCWRGSCCCEASWPTATGDLELDTSCWLSYLPTRTPAVSDRSKTVACLQRNSSLRSIHSRYGSMGHTGHFRNISKNQIQ